MQGLHELSKKTDMNNFEVHIRYSNESRHRWDQDWIKSQLDNYKCDLKRVWVCGPPKMN